MSVVQRDDACKNAALPSIADRWAVTTCPRYGGAPFDFTQHKSFFFF